MRPTGFPGAAVTGVTVGMGATLASEVRLWRAASGLAVLEGGSGGTVELRRPGCLALSGSSSSDARLPSLRLSGGVYDEALVRSAGAEGPKSSAMSFSSLPQLRTSTWEPPEASSFLFACTGLLPPSESFWTEVNSKRVCWMSVSMMLTLLALPSLFLSLTTFWTISAISNELTTWGDWNSHSLSAIAKSRAER
jgi:hypothetical protein